MSYFDDASLVMIPSGYKTSKVYSVKPTDGSGDLTFTRSNDTATRVGPDGLIEKVRTNLLTYSNTFSNAAWVNADTTETSGQAGYDGTNNAWLLSKSAVAANISQNVVATGLLTQSVYAKAGTLNWFVMNNLGLTATGVYFDLQNGVIGNVGANVVSSKIESVGNGWYRCSLTFNGTSSAFRIFPADDDGSVSGTSGNILIQAAQLETGDIATDYIATTTAAVSVGPVANVPRLDYLNSSCPRLLLEPQRTNLFTYSENFDNAAWVKFGSSASANQAVSPDGYTNGDKLLLNNGINVTIPASGLFTSGAAAYVRSGALTLTAASYTFSVFVKKGELDYVQLRSGTDIELTVNASTNLVNLNNGTSSVANSVQDYGNGWYRISHTFTATAATWYVGIWFWNTTSLTANGSQGIFAYGAQLELGSYATSYIPTLGAAVTRGADAASKTGISSLIGSSAGTMYVDLNDFDSPSSAQNGDLIAIQNATPSLGAILLLINRTSKNLQLYQLPQNTTVTIKSGVNTNQRLKVAIVYNGSSFKGFVNGVQTYTGNLTAVAGLSEIIINNIAGKESQAKINQVLIFKTPLSDADAIALTA